ncbi:MAG: hypothetical protein SF052_05640 [Bacteroidia bacterium]|nr:hypothetical protein [Bacteroidia bacterium]
MRFYYCVFFLLWITITLSDPVYAQLGLTADSLTARFGEQTIRRKTPVQSGFFDIMYETRPGYFLLAKIRETDSTTVLLSYSSRNPSIDKNLYNYALRESFPAFKASRKFTSQDPFDRRTCHYNPEKGEMVMRIHGSARREFPLKGFLLVNEQSLIDEILLTIDKQWAEEK